MIRVVRVTGGWRLYNMLPGSGVITSSFSADGLSFTPESGARMAASTVGAAQISTGAFVRLSDGRLRMYFSTFQSTAPTGGLAVETVYSATSEDGLSWALDGGTRTGPGTNVTGSAFHPAALLNPNGSVTLFYFRNSDRSIYYATATDGLAFGTEQRVAIAGFEQNDPDVLELSDGRILLLTARVDSPPPRPPTVYDGTFVTRTAAIVSDLADLDAVLPVALPADHSLRDRIARAKRAHTAGAADGVPYERLAWAINATVDSAGAPAWTRTSVDQLMLLNAFAPATKSQDVPPLEAVLASIRLLNRKTTEPDLQVDPDDWVTTQRLQAIRPDDPPRPSRRGVSGARVTLADRLLIEPARRTVERQLADENSPTSRAAHRFLDLLGIPR